MADTGLILITPLIQEAISNAKSFAAGPLRLAPGWQKEFADLVQSLTTIQAVAEGAEEMQESDPALKLWLQELDDAVYKAVDLLDECGYHVLEMKVETPGQKLEPKQVRASSSPSSLDISLLQPKKVETPGLKLKPEQVQASSSPSSLDTSLLHLKKVETPGLKLTPEQVHTSSATSSLDTFCLHMGGELLKINKSLVEISKEVNFINLMIKFRKQNLASARRPYHKILPILDSSEVVGREVDVSKMVKLLDELRRKHPISGISIVGVAGVGKTTVARLVYMEAEEEERYDVVAWICVSGEFNEQRVLGEMLEYFNVRHVRPNNEIQELRQDLGKELENKTFLLILDDAQDKNPSKWNDFLCHLLEIVKTNGNSIVLTTRSEGVASVVESLVEKLPVYRYDMQRLSDDQCWMIIKKLALSLPSNAIGHFIAKQCGGLPLVATAMGETMNSVEEDERLAIARSREWKLENRNSVLSVLKQSFFDCMPLTLKKCFSYCSVFPKGFEIRKDDLVQLWMASGFLQQSNESCMTMEDVGNEYFNELVSNSLFQDVRRDICGNVESCKMHDVLHDLALFVSKGETFIWETGYCINSQYQNLRINYYEEKPPAIPSDVSQKLRTLFLDGDVPIKMESDGKNLRALKLVGTQAVSSVSLCKSKHLRYLEIAESGSLELPESLSQLYMLQTLKVVRCPRLQMLPDGTSKLVSLRHLYIDDWKLMPRGIRHLTSLQTLPLFFVRRDEGFMIEELGTLSQLGGKLEIQNLRCVSSRSEANKARLIEKTELYDLKFVWTGCEEDEDFLTGHRRMVVTSKDHEEVLEGLQPHSNLKSLSISDYRGSHLPSWINGLSSLKTLKIWGGHSFTCLPIGLGSCSCLQLLEIGSCSFLTSIPEDFSELRSLNILRITDCGYLKSIPEECLGSLTCLKELELGSFSSDLEEFPGLTSIHHLHSSLEGLKLNGWRKLKSLPRQLQHLTALKKLHLSGFEMEAFPEWLGDLSFLTSLSIKNCDKLESIPEKCLGGLTGLKEFGLGPFCKVMNEFLKNTSIHASLERLELFRWRGFQSLPHELQHLTALKELEIRNSEVEDLPEWLDNLPSLRELNIRDCDVYRLPRLSNLQSLIIEKSNRYSWMLREYPQWEKISYIPNIRINGQTVESQHHYDSILRRIEMLNSRGLGIILGL